MMPNMPVSEGHEEDNLAEVLVHLQTETPDAGETEMMEINEGGDDEF